MWRVDPDHASDAIAVPKRHLPNDKPAPVVADEDSLVDFQMIEQADEIAGQVLHIVGLDRLRPVGRAVAALVRSNHAGPGLAKRLDLMTPGKCQLRPTVAKHHWGLIGLRTGFVKAH